MFFVEGNQTNIHECIASLPSEFLSDKNSSENVTSICRQLGRRECPYEWSQREMDDFLYRVSVANYHIKHRNQSDEYKNLFWQTVMWDVDTLDAIRFNIWNWIKRIMKQICFFFLSCHFRYNKKVLLSILFNEKLSRLSMDIVTFPKKNSVIAYRCDEISKLNITNFQTCAR